MSSLLSKSSASREPVVGPQAGGRRRAGAPGAATFLQRVVGVVKPPADTNEALDGQRERLNARLLTATAQVDEARARRRDLYLSDPIDDAAVADAEEMLRVAESRLGGVQEAIGALVEQIETRRAEERAERDAGERERVAAEIEARIARIEKAAVNLDRVAEKFDEARRAVIDVANADLIREPTVEAMAWTPAGKMVAGAARLAGITPSSQLDSIVGAPVSAYGAVHVDVEFMRRLAADIRAGTKPPLLPGVAGVFDMPAMPRVEMVRLTLSRPVSYSLPLVGTIHTLSGEVDLHPEAAEAAIAAGVGFEPGSADGKAITKALRRLGGDQVLKRNDDGHWVRDLGERKDEGGPLVSPETWLALDVRPAR